MKKAVFFVFILFITSCKEQKTKLRYLPDSNANINHLTVVMPEKSWAGALGNQTRALLETPYEGLPLTNPNLRSNISLPRFLQVLQGTVEASCGLKEIALHVSNCQRI